MTSKETAAAEYRKKPVVIEAMQWRGDNEIQIMDFVGKKLEVSKHPARHIEDTPATLIIPTLEGQHIATEGDWIIKGVQGEFYPCKPDIFEKTYERASLQPKEADKDITHYHVADNSDGFRRWLESKGVFYLRNGHFTSIPLEGNDIFSLGVEFGLYRKELKDKDIQSKWISVEADAGGIWGQRVYELLSALCSMWNQYCPEPVGHMCMSAGEEAEEVLDRYKLLKKDSGYGGQVDWDRLEFVKSLLNSDKNVQECDARMPNQGTEPLANSSQPTPKRRRCINS